MTSYVPLMNVPPATTLQHTQSTGVSDSLARSDDSNKNNGGGVHRSERQACSSLSTRAAKLAASANESEPKQKAFSQTNAAKQVSSANKSDSAQKEVSQKPQPTLVIYRLVTQRRWSELRAHVSTSAGRAEAAKYGLVANSQGRTSLHAACYCTDRSSRPPTNVIQLLLDACPFAAAVVDGDGRTPLHAALSSGSSVPSLKALHSLLKRYPPSAGMVDKEGKTPLILLCENFSTVASEEGPGSVSGKESEGISRTTKKMLGIAKILCDAAPLSVNVEDEDGMSALEHAIILDAPLLFVKFLQEASKEACRMQKLWKTQAGDLHGMNKDAKQQQVAQAQRMMMMSEQRVQQSMPAIHLTPPSRKKTPPPRERSNRNLDLGARVTENSSKSTSVRRSDGKFTKTVANVA